MSAGHGEISFNHSCLKIPVKESSNKGSCLKCIGSSFGDSGKAKSRNKPDYKAISYDNFQSVRSYLKFYESIPDYTDLHHLSNEEFYSHLKSLKIRQKEFCDRSGILDHDEDFLTVNPSVDSIYVVGRNDRIKKDDENPAGLYCSICCLDNDYCKALNDEKLNISNSLKQYTSSKTNNILSENDGASELSELKKISDYEADRESSTLQPTEGISGNYLSIREDAESYQEHNRNKRNPTWTRSTTCHCETPDMCCVHPEYSFREHDSSYYKLPQQKNLSRKNQELASDLSIPLTSRIPLYEKLMEEKEARRKYIHERYSEHLKSMVQPFSFTKREENKRFGIARSQPELTSPSVPTVRFKAKPIPKNLFSNYAYERMKEEEFYRALRKRIRAEELLKSSSLPPSMALREKKYLSKSLDVIDDGCKSSLRSCENECKCDGLCDVRNNETSKLIKKKKNRSKSAKRYNLTDSSTEVSPYQSVLGVVKHNFRSHSAYANSHRSNLASLLRIETARNKLRKEMEDKLKESRLKLEAKFKARLIRNAPDWKALNYDKEGDLALRLLARRKENQQRQVRHQKLMESMYKRVYSMPPMFNNERFNKELVKEKLIDKSLNSHSVLTKSEDGKMCTCSSQSPVNENCCYQSLLSFMDCKKK